MAKNFLNKISFGFEECREYRLSAWQCPGFLFIVMGIINISSMIGIYIVVSKYDNPELVIISVSIVSLLIFVVGSSIIKSVEQISTVNKLRSEFVSIASHQLKTPLSGMRWISDILTDSRTGKLNERQEEYLKDIQENISRMLRLINDLLDVSKIESGKMVMDLQKIDLKKIIPIVVRELKPFAKANNIELLVNIDKKAGEVKSDPVKIKMVIQNFIDNAIKYVGPKQGKVEVFLENKGKNVYCHVKDNGVGISKEEQKKVFDKFFRGNNVIKKQTVGTGLGLFIAKAVIESSNGKIGFNSEEGKGSTFWFTLPVVKI